MEEVKPTALTLCFKHGKQTILLFVDPLTTFPVIIKELLLTLRERYPGGLPTTLTGEPTFTPIPESSVDVILGVPKDVYDIEKGWEELNIAGTGLKETPKSLGLKDGAQLAFAFAESEVWTKTGTFHVEYSNLDELYPEEE